MAWKWKQRQFWSWYWRPWLSGRNHFDRPCSLLEERFPAGWLAALFIIFCTSVWLGVFSHRHFDLPRMWLTFGFRESAPRFLRAITGVALAFLLFFLARRRRLSLAPSPPAAPERQRAARILAELGAPAFPALADPPSLLFTQDGAAFLLYGIAGDSWIGLGDPVGAAPQRAELAWRFREMSECAGGRSVFFAVGENDLSVYLDMGLGLLPIGREARISVADFSPAANLERVYRLRLDQGYRLEVCPATETAPLLPEVRRICDADCRLRRLGPRSEWLAEQAGRFPLAVVRRDGQIVAVASLRPETARRELTVDFLRQTAEAPAKMPEFLFFALLRWGQGENFRWLNLGTGPLPEGRDNPLEPIWERLGTRLFRHGEHFARAEDLRVFQESFHPHWSLRYLACPEGSALPVILQDIAALLTGETLDGP